MTRCLLNPALAAGAVALSLSTPFAFATPVDGATATDPAADCAQAGVTACRYTISQSFAALGGATLTGSFDFNIDGALATEDPDAFTGAGLAFSGDAVSNVSLSLNVPGGGDVPLGSAADPTSPGVSVMGRRAELGNSQHVFLLEAAGASLAEGESTFVAITFFELGSEDVLLDLTEPAFFVTIQLAFSDDPAAFNFLTDTPGFVAESTVVSVSYFDPPTLVVPDDPDEPEDPCTDDGLGFTCETLDEQVGGVVPAPAAPFALALMALVGLRRLLSA